jgi:hypothetical protein
MGKKDILNICDQLGITYQAQPGFQNESLFYKDFYVGSIDKFGRKYSIYCHVPKEIDESGLLETKDKIIAALNFKIKSAKEFEALRRQVEMEKDFE